MRKLCLLAVCTLLVTGCTDKKPMMGPPQKPVPAPELQKLSWLVGNWDGTAEMVSPSAQDMKKSMPAGSKMPEMTFKGAGKTEMTLSNMFIRSEGWHEMGDGQKQTYLEYITWDASKKKYRSHYFSDWGEFGTGLMTPSADGKTLTITVEGQTADGTKKTGSGSMTKVDDNNMTWTWSETGPQGTFKLKGKQTRAK